MDCSWARGNSRSRNFGAALGVCMVFGPAMGPLFAEEATDPARAHSQGRRPSPSASPHPAAGSSTSSGAHAGSQGHSGKPPGTPSHAGSQGAHGGHGVHGAPQGHGGPGNHGGHPQGGAGTHALLPRAPSVPLPPAPPKTDSAWAKELVERIQFLSSEAFEGRGTGTPGGTRAASFLAGQFAVLGLSPLPGRVGYLDSFPVLLKSEPTGNNRIRIGAKTFARAKAFRPYPMSDNGTAKGSLAFVGYGISAPDLGYDDYQGIDVEGKILLAFEGEPQETRKDSPFRKPEAFRYRKLRMKAMEARNRGALGLILVRRPTKKGRRAKARLTNGVGVAGSRAGIQLATLRLKELEAGLKPSGFSLRKAYKEIEKKGQPQSRLLELEVELTTEVKDQRGTGYNVVGRVPGTSPEGLPPLVLGAHFDHLGRGEAGSLAPDQLGQVHHGADDNASGTVALLELARLFRREPLARDVWFLAFGGEEMGLLGSHHFVREVMPKLPVPTPKAMVNMDMVGRMRKQKLFVHGVGTAKELRGLVESSLADARLELGFGSDGYGPSDHTAFYAAKIPVLFFFTGPHSEYHRPQDRWELIEGKGLVQIVGAVETVVRALDPKDQTLTLIETEREAPKPGRSNSGGGYGPYFGSIPDFSEHSGGVLLSGVRKGSPASKTGLTGGDLLIEFGGKKIENLHDFTFALRAFRPGDVVEVAYRRKDKVLRGKAELGRRK